MVKKSSLYFHWVLLFILAIAVALVSSQVTYHVAKNRKFIKPSKNLVNFTLGFHAVLADSLWLRVVQDMGLCEQKRAPEGAPRFGINRVSDCEKSWGFHMIDVVTDLDKGFYAAFLHGATALSVIADDVLGAKIIFDKGAEAFPSDWQLIYRAGTHNLTEVGDNERAAQLLQQAARNGAPEWVHILASRAFSRAGQALLAKSVVESYLKSSKDAPRFKHRAEQRLQEINAILADEKNKKK